MATVSSGGPGTGSPEARTWARAPGGESMRGFRGGNPPALGRDDGRRGGDPCRDKGQCLQGPGRNGWSGRAFQPWPTAWLALQAGSAHRGQPRSTDSGGSGCRRRSRRSRGRSQLQSSRLTVLITRLHLCTNRRRISQALAAHARSSDPQRLVAPVRPNRHRYLASIAEEVHAQSKRVRDLIGDRHWLSDGHHKEYLLASVLERHFPGSVIARRGFVVSASDVDTCSTEQDILIADTTHEAPVFNQGGLMVTLPGTILGAISVKTRLTPAGVRDSVKGLGTVRAVAASSGFDNSRIWCGAYFFEEEASKTESMYEVIKSAVASAATGASSITRRHPEPTGPDLLATSREFVYRINYAAIGASEANPTKRISGFRCGGLGTAVFFANLLDHIATTRGATHADFADFADDPLVEVLDPPTLDFI